VLEFLNPFGQGLEKAHLEIVSPTVDDPIIPFHFNPTEYQVQKTNNFAEYSGLLTALEYAIGEKYPSLKVLSDSELLVRQMQGRYRVKSPGLIELYERAQSLVRKLQHFSIEHVLREYNRDADRLVNKVLDSRERGPRT